MQAWSRALSWIVSLLTISALLQGLALGQTDRDALISLYNSTDGDNWIDNTGWKDPPTSGDGFNDDPCSEPRWFGVFCEGGRVTTLQLRSNGLTGQIPVGIWQLSGLQELNLFGNQLTSAIPSELGRLASLQILNLGRNQLTGVIPSELANLASLQRLWLFDNQLTGAIPPELGGMASLQQLLLDVNQLTGAIPPELGSLASLQRLTLLGNQLTGAIPHELGGLASLQLLNLSNNQLEGAILPGLGSLTSLQHLALRHNQLTGAIPPELGSLASLQELDLSSNQLTGAIPPELGSLTSLQGLVLSSNQLTGAIPPELGSLTSLQRLFLAGNQLTGAIPPELGSLTSLQRLFLAGTQLTGAIPPELGSLTSLQILDLSSNQLTGAIPEELGGLLNLTDGSGLRLAFNHLYTDSNTLRDFLDGKSSAFGDWESTQTLHSYYAHFADGLGLGSQIVLFNLNDKSAATGQMQVLGGPGSDLTVDLNGEVFDGPLNVSVPAAGLLSLGTDGMGELQAGSVRVTTDRHVQGVVIFGGGVGLAGVGSSPSFLCGLAAPMQSNEAKGINTGIAVTSLGDQDGPLALTLLDAGGMTLAAASDVLPAQGHKALFVDQIDWETPVDFSNFAGTLVVTGQQPLTATVIQTRPGEFVTMPVAPFEAPQPQPAVVDPQGAAAEHRLYFAQFGDGGGLLTSQILLLNLSAEKTATAEITLRDDLGEPLTVDLNGEDVTGNMQVQIAASGLQILATDGLGDLVVGSVSVASDQPLAGVIVFAGEVVGAAGVGSSAELPEGFLAPMEAKSAAAIRTGVAIMSLEAAELVLTVDLIASDGSLLDSVQRNLAPLGHLAIFLEQFGWNDSVDLSQFEGLLRVRSDGRIAATVIQTRPGQFATMPVAAKPLN